MAEGEDDARLQIVTWIASGTAGSACALILDHNGHIPNVKPSDARGVRGTRHGDEARKGSGQSFQSKPPAVDETLQDALARGSVFRSVRLARGSSETLLFVW